MQNYERVLEHALYKYLIIFGILLFIGVLVLGFSIKFDNVKKRNGGIILIVISLLICSWFTVPIIMDLGGNCYMESDVIYNRAHFNSKNEVYAYITEGDRNYSLKLPYLNEEDFPMGVWEAHIVYAQHSKILLEVKVINKK